MKKKDKTKRLLKDWVSKQLSDSLGDFRVVHDCNLKVADETAYVEYKATPCFPGNMLATLQSKYSHLIRQGSLEINDFSEHIRRWLKVLAPSRPKDRLTVFWSRNCKDRSKIFVGVSLPKLQGP